MKKNNVNSQTNLRILFKLIHNRNYPANYLKISLKFESKSERKDVLDPLEWYNCCDHFCIQKISKFPKNTFIDAIFILTKTSFADHTRNALYKSYITFFSYPGTHLIAFSCAVFFLERWPFMCKTCMHVLNIMLQEILPILIAQNSSNGC